MASASRRYLAVMSMAVTSSYKSFFDGLGHTHVHFVVAVIMNTLNLILNYGLIYGHFGLPRMGVPGSGLGLHISRRLAEQQGGHLWLDDSTDVGSVFALSLPVAG